MTPRPLPELPRTFRSYRVATSSERRGAELEKTYGLADGLEGSLDQFQYVSAGDADLSMRSAIVNGTRTGRMQRRPDHIVFWIGDGTATVTPESDPPLNVTPGRPILLSGSVVYSFDTDVRKISMLHVSEQLLRRQLSDRDIHLSSPLVFAEEPASRDALRHLRTVLQTSTPELVDAALGDTQRKKLNAHVANAIIDTFPVRFSPNSTATPLSRAVELMHEAARTPLSMRDITAASGLGIRGLQTTFARTLSTTPMRYLRNIRLDGAHGELERGEAATVAEVARKWQFNHLGRFANTYNDRFGERPNETLRRART